MSSMTLSSQEKPLFQKRIPWWHLFYSVHTFARIRQHYFSKYWGTDAWAFPPPHIFLGGPSPLVPPRSPPLWLGGTLEHCTCTICTCMYACVYACMYDICMHVCSSVQLWMYIIIVHIVILCQLFELIWFYLCHIIFSGILFATGTTCSNCLRHHLWSLAWRRTPSAVT